MTKFRAVIAAGPRGTTIIVSHDSADLAYDLGDIPNHVEDIGLPQTPDEGIWLLEGTVTMRESGGAPWDGQEPPTPDYEGTYRKPTSLDELNAWLDLSPPVEDERDGPVIPPEEA